MTIRSLCEPPGADPHAGRWGGGIPQTIQLAISYFLGKYFTLLIFLKSESWVQKIEVSRYLRR